MFSALSGKKAIADDFENRTRCTIYQNRHGWQGFQRIKGCDCLFKNRRRKEDRILQNLKKKRKKCNHATLKSYQ